MLTEIALRHGFADDEVAGLLADERELAITRSDAAQAAASGITGVPFYVLDQRYAISGAQQEEALRVAIERAAAENGNPTTTPAAWAR